MGTRADFYVGRGPDAEWLGSIAWDGYPSGIPQTVRGAATEIGFRTGLAAFFAEREDVTMPEQGWPWPWDDSATTDFAYAFDGSDVWVAGFGRSWVEAATAHSHEEDDVVEQSEGEPAVFPDMSERKNVTFGPRSGVMLVGVSK